MMREAPEARVGSDSNFWVPSPQKDGDTVIQLEACFWYIFPYMNG